MGTAIAKVVKQVSPREHQLFLGVPFYLFGYKRGCWVTAIDPRLQNLEFGYSYLAVTADCIHKCVIFHLRTQSLIQWLCTEIFFYYNEIGAIQNTLAYLADNGEDISIISRAY